ncbi:MAG: TonB-dependent receptor [Bacteroidota bacterium]
MNTKYLYFLLLITSSIWAQNESTENNPQQKITGSIKDQNGSPVFGALVYIKGSNVSSITDSLGQFNITINQELPLKLKVTYLGYKQIEKEIRLASELAIDFKLEPDNILNEVQVVTSRRREEAVQQVPIPITVIGGAKADDAGAFNVNRVKELTPSVQLYSSNPRNTTLNIRGLGSTYGLTNDGIDPGVGFYVDGVYYARPAATTFDFIDIERIEVLRGPQGTLFGKNTTAGAFNITTRLPTFIPEASAEISYGNFQYVQAKATISDGITKKIAARISFSGTQRDGVIQNIKTNSYTNTLNNQGVRGQLLFVPTDKLNIVLSGNYNIQRPDGYAQVVAGVVTTERASYRQFDAITKDLNYTLPGSNAFDRKIDHDTPWKSYQEIGGASLNMDYKIGKGTITSTTAWAFWNWDPSNDRDFTGLEALRLSQNPAKHQQYSQEVRYSGQITSKLSAVIGVYAINQDVSISGTEESGKDQWRFSQSSTSALWKTPGLFEGYGIKTKANINSTSAAVFAQVDWNVVKGLHILPGIRYNYDEKNADYNRTTYGGLETTNSQLLALKKSVYSDQAYQKRASNTNLSGNLTLSYNFNNRVSVFATYSTSYKPIGVNVAGLPTTTSGDADLDLAVIKPEEVSHYELGIKTSPVRRSTLNLTVYNTDITNFQTNVQSPELGINRGYLANAEKVNVRGIELESSIAIKNFWSLFANVSYTDGKYVKFTNAPLPLEETGKTVDGKQVAFKDVSGGRLPGISDWAGTVGNEFSIAGNFLKNSGRFYLASELSYRSDFSSSPTPSQYLNIEAYSILNARIGFRTTKGISFIIWSRNLLDQNYYEQLLPAGGNAGQYAAVLGDQRTYGITLRYSFK